MFKFRTLFKSAYGRVTTGLLVVIGFVVIAAA